jgi:hypothetical protein
MATKTAAKAKTSTKVAVFALIEPQQKAALEEISRLETRSVGFLVREAVADYLAKPRKKS